MINEIGKNSGLKYKKFIDKVVAERRMAKQLEFNQVNSQIGLSPLIAKRRQLHSEQRGTEKFADNNLEDNPEQDKVHAGEQPHSLKTKANSADLQLEAMAEIGADGQFIKEDKTEGDAKKFEAPAIESKPQGAKSITIDADDNATRAEQAVREPAIQIKTAKPEIKKVPPQIDVNADQLREDAPVAEQRQEPELKIEPQEPIEKPVVTVDKIQRAPREETIKIKADPNIVVDLEKVTDKPTPAETPAITNPQNYIPERQETVEQKDLTAQQADEQVPITVQTVDGTVQPDGKYLEGAGPKDSDRGGLERIQEIKRGINGNQNAESTGPPESDKLDKEVQQVREETLIKDGINPDQVEIIQKPAEQEIVEQPTVEISDGSNAGGDEGIHRLVMNRLPDRDPLREARMIAKIPPDKISAADLYQLRPGNMTEQTESEEEELPMTA